MAASGGSANRQVVLAGVLIACLAIIGYMWYGGYLGGGSDAVVETVADATQATGEQVAVSKDAQDILNAIAVLNSTVLDTAFFDDERFRALLEVQYSIPPVRPSGRTPLKFFYKQTSSSDGR